MGVHGLWRLIEPSGKPVPLETLENKVLAVDISIWLHQAVKGFQDSRGASVPNAHLLGIYHRICKLLYFKIKPVFVFDGGVPALKKQTIAKRTQSKLRTISQADKIQKQLLSTLLKHSAVSKVLTEKIEASIGAIPKLPSRSSKEDMYILPSGSELDSTISSSEDESYSETTMTDSSPTKNWDLHTIDMDSVHFKSLPVDVRHEILTDLKETRKQSSWGRLHELPKVSDDFSIYQMRRLLKRQAVQTALEDAEKEMGGKSLSLVELESILKDQGVITNQDIGNRIASDETTKYLLVKDLKQALEDAKKKEQKSENSATEENEVLLINVEDDNVKGSLEEESKSLKTKADLEYEDDLKRAIALSLECEPSTSDENITFEKKKFYSRKAAQQKLNPAEFSFLENYTDADFASSSSEDEESILKLKKTTMSSAQSYMLEYSGLTPNEIVKIMNTNIVNTESKKFKLKKSTMETINENCNDISSTTDISNEVIRVKSVEYTENVDSKPVNNNKDENIDGSIEIMSSTNSSDSEAEAKSELKDVNIVINPNSDYNEEEDLFADVFKSVVSKSQASSDDQITIADVNDNKSKPTSGPDIVVSTTGEFDENNHLFSDIFIQKKSSIGEVLTSNNDNVTSTEIKESQNITDQEISIQNKDNITVPQKITLTSGKKSSDVVEHNIEDNNADNIETEQKPSSKPLNEDVSNLIIKENVANNKPKISQKPPMTEGELKQLQDQLRLDRIDLDNEKSTKERMASNITDQMYQEAQDLLELFGVPYIIAPMEAEAQCAFLDAIELTDGTITDDSDIWLFGGKTVYKNFFNQSKYVMEFRAENINHHFKLTREQMILLALLVGSDYTIGLQGVGPVTAMEILAAFPPSKGKINEFSLSHSDLLSGLQEFRSWFAKGKSSGPGRSALKSKLKNLCFTENFPSLQVIQAYLDPTVETSRETFSWGKPNAMALLEFAREKFGWTKTKTEEILNPVLKKLEESKHQKSITDYFKTRFRVHSGEAESKMSKRVKSAITNMGKDPSEVIAKELQQELKKEPRKKVTGSKKGGKEAPEFSKVSKSKVRSKAGTQENDNFENPDNIQRTKKTTKVKLHKLKSSVEQHLDETSNTEQTKNKSDDVESKEQNEETDISEKINVIRKRRKIKEAKAAIEIKKPKVTKEKKLTSQISDNILNDLGVDEEINLLSQVIVQSSQKVEDINKTMLERFQSLENKSLETFKLNASPSTSNPSQPSTSGHRPAFRPTRIPRKESIPQQEKDKTILLRNKLKAIEVYRRGKHGPGFVPKRDRNKRLPKADAELSESSDE